MIIRCERCSTMYELDESLLAPEGSQVQCTKCQHVFTATPPAAADRAVAGVPAQPAPEARGETAPAPPRPPPPAPAAPQVAPRESTAPRARIGSPAVYRPPTTPSAPVARAPMLKRDTVGAFESRLRWNARWRWLAPGVVVALLVAAAGAWMLLRRSGDAGAARAAQSEALALVARDDAASLDAAAARLAETARRSPKLKSAAADRALALVLRAAGVADERDAIAARLSSRVEELERLRREAPAGWEEAERAAAADVAGLEAEMRRREEEVRRLASEAMDQLTAVQGQGDIPEVARAFAALHVLRGEHEQAHRLLRAVRERGRRDAWLDLADGWLDARDPERSTRDRALMKLGALAAARPDLLRGRYLLARAEASLGRRTEAVATLDGILAANGKHESARRLREELSVAPPVAAPAPAPQPAAKPAPPPRKIVPQPAPTPSDERSPAPPTPDAEAQPQAVSPTPAAEAAPAPPAAGPPPQPQTQPESPVARPPQPQRTRPRSPLDPDAQGG